MSWHARVSVQTPEDTVSSAVSFEHRRAGGPQGAELPGCPGAGFYEPRPGRGTRPGVRMTNRGNAKGPEAVAGSWQRFPWFPGKERS